MRIAAILILITLITVGAVIPAQAQSPTPTVTPSPSATPLSNSDRTILSTVAPPNACGLATYNPCGPLPFQVPKFQGITLPSPTAWPTVPSPTPIPASATPTFTLTPTNTPTGTITPAPTNTGTPGPSPTPNATDFSVEAVGTLGAGFNDMAGTLVYQSTRQLIIDSTPQGPRGVASGLGSYAGALFSVAKSFTSNFGKAGPVVVFLILALAYVIILYIVTFIAPILFALVRFILELINTAKPI